MTFVVDTRTGLPRRKPLHAICLVVPEALVPPLWLTRHGSWSFHRERDAQLFEDAADGVRAAHRSVVPRQLLPYLTPEEVLR